MVTVKIECGCGQHYAFDVEPVNGQMSSAVACPVCGADGTAAANAIIAGKTPPPFTGPPVRSTSPVPGPRPGPVRVNTPAPPTPAIAPAGVRVNARSLGLVDRATAETEARAKISWGDSQNEVISYLMLQGFTAAEANELVVVLFKERLAALRVKGIRKIIVGFGLMCVPVIAWIAMGRLAMIFIKAMAVAVMVGLWGVWEFLNGVIILVAPKMEAGKDVAE